MWFRRCVKIFQRRNLTLVQCWYFVVDQKQNVKRNRSVPSLSSANVDRPCFALFEQTLADNFDHQRQTIPQQSAKEESSVRSQHPRYDRYLENMPSFLHFFDVFIGEFRAFFSVGYRLRISDCWWFRYERNVLIAAFVQIDDFVLFRVVGVAFENVEMFTAEDQNAFAAV